jgi:hypothetical protein
VEKRILKPIEDREESQQTKQQPGPVTATTTTTPIVENNSDVSTMQVDESSWTAIEEPRIDGDDSTNVDRCEIM